jgi:hypothetical protein
VSTYTTHKRRSAWLYGHRVNYPSVIYRNNPTSPNGWK